MPTSPGRKGSPGGESPPYAKAKSHAQSPAILYNKGLCISLFFQDSLHVLQCLEVFLSGPDLHDAHHIVDEDLSISDVPGVKSLLGRCDH